MTLTACHGDLPDGRGGAAASLPSLVSASLPSLVSATLDAGPGPGDRFEAASGAERREIARDVRRWSTHGRGPVPSGFAARQVTDDAGVTVLTETALSRGWGLYAVRPGARDLVIEVPHPRADEASEVIGVGLFASTKARALLVAGADRSAGRRAADVAHNAATPFAEVSAALASTQTTIVQVHGFDQDNHEENLRDVVVSSGTKDVTTPVRSLAEALRHKGFDVCVYDGSACQALAATKNIQGRAARAAGADFVHIEIARGIRTSEDRRATVVEAITAGLDQPGS
ncbi:hypothetical protein ACQP1U_08240 [Actinomycetota bacterium]